MDSFKIIIYNVIGQIYFFTNKQNLKIIAAYSNNKIRDRRKNESYYYFIP